MSLFRRSIKLPDALRRALDADEVVLAYSVAVDGVAVAATRKRLIVLGPADPVATQAVVGDQATGQRDSARHEPGDSPSSVYWAEIAKARLADGVLSVVPLEKVASLQDGTEILRDGSPLTFIFDRPARLTDQVHSRVRRSVAASRHLPWPGAGGWVTARRVAGRDGLVLQVRLDPGADPAAAGFVDAALQAGRELIEHASPGVTGVDD